MPTGRPPPEAADPRLLPSDPRLTGKEGTFVTDANFVVYSRTKACSRGSVYNLKDLSQPAVALGFNRI